MIRIDYLDLFDVCVCVCVCFFFVCLESVKSNFINDDKSFIFLSFEEENLRENERFKISGFYLWYLPGDEV